MEAKRALCLNEKDNVAVAVENIGEGDTVCIEIKGAGTQLLKSVHGIPFGFKLARMDIPKGSHILKYGEVIGRATDSLKTGELVHVHNIEGIRVQKVQGLESDK